MGRKWPGRIVVYVIVVVWILPLFWAALSAFHTSQAIALTPFNLLVHPTFHNFATVFASYPFGRYLLNSGVASFGSALAALVVGTMAGYAMARHNVGGKGLASWILSTRMAPPVVFVVPFYLMFQELGILDTWMALIIAYTTFDVAFVAWMVLKYLKDVAVSLEEAASVDGASPWDAFRLITLPVLKPALASLMIFSLIFSWNDFLYASVLATDRVAKTASVGIGQFVSSYGVHWGPLFAASLVTIIPVLVFSLIFQRYIVAGLSMGAVKG